MLVSFNKNSPIHTGPVHALQLHLHAALVIPRAANRATTVIHLPIKQGVTARMLKAASYGLLWDYLPELRLIRILTLLIPNDDIS